jgi:hypothetical protein
MGIEVRAMCSAIIVASVAVTASAKSRRIAFPDDSGVVNVQTRFGARGDGQADDTAAIQNALDWATSSGNEHNILYFPDGTYLVSDTVSWTWFTHLQGQSKAGTIIKLVDSAEGFSSPDNPKPVVLCYKNSNATHTNYIHDMTVDTGKGNPGAVGVDFTSHNTGAMRHVTIRSGDGAGAIGLSMLRKYPGPCLIQHVSIEGFDYGIRTRDSNSYNIVFEHIVLRNQKVAGIDNRMPISIRGLASDNTVPAVVTTGPLTLVEAKLAGGEADAAIVNNGGTIYLRDIEYDGYQAPLIENGALIQRPRIDQHVTGNRIHMLFDSPRRSLRLPIEEPPAAEHEPIGKWQGIFGAGGDDTAEIQAAIDSGASTIYFSRQGGRAFHVNDTIVVRGNVRRIVGMNANVYGDDASFIAKPVFRFENDQPVVVERLNASYRNAPPGKPANSFQFAGPGTVFLQSCHFGKLTNRSGAGKLFCEDNNGRLALDHPQQIWMRQWNPEAFFRRGAVPEDRHATLNSVTLWVLGMKTEGQITKGEFHNGTKFELLGGYFLGVDQFPKDYPMFIVHESQVSLNYMEHHWPKPHAIHDIQVIEVRDGQRRELRRTDALMPDEVVPLYVGSSK